MEELRGHVLKESWDLQSRNHWQREFALCCCRFSGTIKTPHGAAMGKKQYNATAAFKSYQENQMNRGTSCRCSLEVLTFTIKHDETLMLLSTRYIKVNHKNKNKKKTCRRHRSLFGFDAARVYSKKFLMCLQQPKSRSNRGAGQWRQHGCWWTVKLFSSVAPGLLGKCSQRGKRSNLNLKRRWRYWERPAWNNPAGAQTTPGVGGAMRARRTARLASLMDDITGLIDRQLFDEPSHSRPHG